MVMAHGFAAERGWRLPEYAERFAEKGLSVLLFDYRNFGDSSGRPRNLVHPNLQCEDWVEAVRHVRSMEQIDSKRIGLWGTSFSGGHVLVTAAKGLDIKAVVAQVPFVDSFASAGSGNIRQMGRLFYAAFLDLIMSWVGKEEIKIGITGKPGSLAFLTHEGWEEQYRRLIPEGTEWENLSPARGLFPMSIYRPVKSVDRIDCPVLVIYAIHDEGSPADAVEKAAAGIANVTKIKYDCGHFDIYFRDFFEKAVDQAAAFFIQELEAERTT